MAGISGGSKRSVIIQDFWSAYQEEIAVTATATDTSMPSVVISSLPSGATVNTVTALVKFRTIEDTSAAANKLSGAQNIQVKKSTSSTWVDAIALVDDLFGIAASTREGGDALIGLTDISAEVTENATYNFQWALAIADGANLNFNDVQTGLRVEYSV